MLAGDVLLLPERRRARKPGELVPEDVELEVVAAPPFVSRGGIKLANALDALALDVAGRSALDVGASTGGFTDCLLQRGAGHVVAVDVAYGELDWRLRSDPRVTVIERCNARQLTRRTAPVRARSDRGRRVLHLAGQGASGGARVRRRARSTAWRWSSPSSRSAASRSARAAWSATPRVRRGALVASGERRAGWARRCSATRAPGLPGPKGNLETFIWLAEGDRGGLGDLESAAREVEP